ncbi:MAG: ribosome maturation factor RimP [Solirubrobacterales bacterium]
MNSALQADKTQRLSESRPEVEVLLVEPVGADKLRVTIDHPEGVSLDLCEAVTGDLAPLREQYALEVSSPGRRRPLTRPAHFERFAGRKARLRLSPSGGRPATITGEIAGVDGDSVTIAGPDGVSTVSFGEIKRATLIEE